MVNLEALRFDPFLNPLILGPLALLLFLSVRRSYVRTTRRLSGARLFVLVLLRLCAFAAVLLCLARPVLVQQKELRERGLCFIAVDSSASMDLRDTAGGRTRWQTATDIISAQRRELGRLSSDFELQRYLFDSTPRRLEELPGEAAAVGRVANSPHTNAGGAAPIGPTGLSTDVAAMLEVLAAEAGGNPGASAILISDGRHNGPQDVISAALALQRAGVPLYCIGLGQEATPAAYKDIRIRELVVPDKAFVGSHMLLRVEVDSTLPSPAVVPLTVEIAGQKIHQSMLSLAPGANVPAAPVEITYVPEALGVHRVLATVGQVPDEVDTANNSRTAFFRVYRTKLGVWFVEGAIRKEFGAVRSVLETAPNIQLTALNAFNVRTSAARELLPWREEDWAQLRLVILGDLPAARFEPQALQALAKFVEDGGAVLMIGGVSNLGMGGWQNTPLAPVLPVILGRDDGVAEGPLPVKVSPLESAHGVLAIGDTPAQSAALWKLIPPLPVVDRVANTRPAAHVLLHAGDSPFLIVQEYGKGRAAVLTADSTWQWAVKAGQSETPKHFWRNLATWLTHSDYRDTDKAVFVDVERLQYRVGEEAAFHVVAHETEKTGAALKSARVVIAVSRFLEELEAPVWKEELGAGPGDYSKRLALGFPGNYRCRALALGADDKALDSDSVDFQVAAPDVEHDNPKANLSLLRRIAALSGGMYYDPAHAADAFQAVAKRQASFSKTVAEAAEAWNRPWLLAFFAGFLTLEWMLRKRWGLV
ncbi:MAG: glutamine amidotransferase [Planctomycetota bacterium]